MKQPEPNYKILYDSAVCSLQIAYKEYKKALMDNIKWTWIDDEGKFCVLSGHEERQKKIEDLARKMVIIQDKVNEYRVLKGDT